MNSSQKTLPFQPVRLLIVRQKDQNDRSKGYEVFTVGKTWDLLANADGKPLTPEEIIKLARRTGKHILWNPILRRKKDISILERTGEVA